MVRRITAALRRSLETCHWLEGNSRSVALKKLDRMTANVGYPDELGNETMLEEYYRTFNDSTDRFFSTWLGARVAYQHRLLTDRETYLFNSVAANAFYTRHANRILIPAAILQPEIYFPDGPLSGAYGSLGQVIGHEIMHGFDVQGFKYDENNEARSWATPDAMEHYRKEALCLRKSHKRVRTRCGAFLECKLCLEREPRTRRPTLRFYPPPSVQRRAPVALTPCEHSNALTIASEQL
ncbi:hypothetical protein HPB51_019540 [Rhipicephalus microplus]|uniref:Peptidase M13 C-terminal domain-containing protein n=1 Tax=Rhipicephalus microplus TaxID=6941 RepID=A0A9J6F5N2_RHIMP|nr:hypothetical protein HPB51_019540 [Rhipicephalus microplus]